MTPRITESGLAPLHSTSLRSPSERDLELTRRINEPAAATQELEAGSAAERDLSVIEWLYYWPQLGDFAWIRLEIKVRMVTLIARPDLTSKLGLVPGQG